MTRPFLLVMWSTLAYFICVGALLPTLPLYVEGPLGGGTVAVGMTIGIFSLAAVLIRPFTGRVGDTRGRRPLLVAGAAVVGVAVLGYLVVDSLALLLVLRIVAGAGEAAFYVGAASAINDISPDERRGEAFSYFSLALFGGLALGPILGEQALEWGGYDSAWIVAASGALLAALVALKVPETRPDTDDDRPRGKTPLVHRAGLLPGTILAAHIWGLASFISFLPLYVLDLGLQGSKYIFALHSGILLVIRSLGARLPDRLGPRLSARASLSCSTVGLAVMAIWGTVPGLIVGTILFSIGHSLLFPALMILAINGAPASERASVVSTFTAFFDLAFGLGAVSAGAVAAVLGYRGAFAASGVAAFSGLVLLNLYARRADRRESPGAPNLAEARPTSPTG
ncbi:MAG: MFS transporter [Actinomycetota bacterium]|nr:MFS transporter [Actinomycetota bacterium]